MKDCSVAEAVAEMWRVHGTRLEALVGSGLPSPHTPSLPALFRSHQWIAAPALVSVTIAGKPKSWAELCKHCPARNSDRSWYFPPSYLSGFSKLPYLSSNCTSCCLYATKSKCTFLLHGWWTPTGMLSEFGVEILNVFRALAKNWRKNRAPFKLYYLIKYAVIKKIEFTVYETNWYLFKETHF